MKTSLFVVLSLLLAQCACSQGPNIDGQHGDDGGSHTSPENIVLSLDSHNFTEVVNSEAHVLVYFSSSWCGYCKQLRPEYLKAAAMAYTEGLAIRLAILESSPSNKQLLEDLRITKFPTVILMRSGKAATSYAGEYKATSILRFIKSKLADKVVEIHSLHELQGLLADVRDSPAFSPGAKCVLGIQASRSGQDGNKEPSQAETTFLAAAEGKPSLESYGPYALSHSLELYTLLEKFIDEKIIRSHSSSDFYVLVYSAEDPEPLSALLLDDAESVGNLLRYLDSFHLPVILKYNESNLNRIQWYSRGVQVLVFSPSSGDEAPYQQDWPSWMGNPDEVELHPWNKAGDYFISAISWVADRYRGRALFVHIPESEYHIYQIFRVSRQEGFNPEVIIVDLRENGEMSKYTFSFYERNEGLISGAMQEISEHFAANSGGHISSDGRVGDFCIAMNNMLQDFFEDSLKPTLLSEKPDSVPQVQRGLRKLVSGTFAETVGDPDVDLYLVAFVSPWCGHCKALEPVIDALGKYYDNYEDATVRIGRIDASLNEVVYEGVKIFGYPTIYAFLKTQTPSESDSCSEGTEQSCLANSDGDFVMTLAEYDGPRTVKDLKTFIRKLLLR